MIPPSFPRELSIIEPSKLTGYFHPIITEMKSLIKLMSLNSFQQFLDFFRSFSEKSPCLVNRSLIFLMFLPANRKILGRYMMADTIEQSISQNVKLNLDFHSPKCEYLLSRLTKVFCQIIQCYSYNRGKQREKIEFELDSLGDLMTEVETLVIQVKFVVKMVANIIQRAKKHRKTTCRLYPLYVGSSKAIFI